MYHSLSSTLYILYTVKKKTYHRLAIKISVYWTTYIYNILVLNDMIYEFHWTVPWIECILLFSMPNRCNLTFSPKTKYGDGNLGSLLMMFTDDLWMRATFPSAVRTFLFSLWKQMFGYRPTQSSATIYVMWWSCDYPHRSCDCIQLYIPCLLAHPDQSPLLDRVQNTPLGNQRW